MVKMMVMMTMRKRRMAVDLVAAVEHHVAVPVIKAVPVHAMLNARALPSRAKVFSN